MKHVRSLMNKVRRGEGGFTLIELLVVIAILGIIAAVVILNVGGFMGRGTVEAANTEFHNVQTAVIAYMVDNANTPPGAVSELIPTYLMSNVKAVYSITNSTGEVTGTGAGTWGSSIEWDSTNHCWKEAA